MADATVVSVTSPLAPTLFPTHTSANDAPSLPSWWPTNVVVGETLTVNVLPSRSVTVNVPVSPEPHAVGSVEPFTDTTSPNTPSCSCSCSGSGCWGGTMTEAPSSWCPWWWAFSALLTRTLSAATVVPSTMPLTFTREPTHTFANNASVT